MKKLDTYIRNRSLPRETHQCMNSFIEMDCLGAYNVE